MYERTVRIVNPQNVKMWAVRCIRTDGAGQQAMIASTPLNALLKALRLRAGLSMQDMAQALGMPRASSYQYYEKGFAGAALPDTIADAVLATLRDKGDPPITDDDLRGLLGRRSQPAETSGEFVPIPVYDIQASAGHGSLVEDGAPLHHQMFREQFLRRVTRAPVAKLAVIHVDGDSMADTLLNGDQVLVDRTVTRVVKPGLYVILFDGELIVKRCQRDMKTGALLIQSDNPLYGGQRIEPDDPVIFKIVGRVVWMGRALA